LAGLAGSATTLLRAGFFSLVTSALKARASGVRQERYSMAMPMGVCGELIGLYSLISSWFCSLAVPAGKSRM